MKLGIPAALLAVFAFAIVPAAAQDAALARVDAAIARGATDEARRELDAWWASTGAGNTSVSSRIRAHAIFLRAELSTDPRQAQNDYLTVALDFPTAPDASAALLRGAQALVLRGEAERARTYLERLRRDYPGGEHHAAGLLWLARVRRSTGTGDPCEAVDVGIAAARDDQELRALLLGEKAACAPARVAATPAAKPPTDRPPAAQAAPPTANPSATQGGQPAAAAGNYAVQVGAFRSATGASALAARLRELGFDSRVVLVPGNELLRVRVGRFEGVTPARELRQQLADANIDGVVVIDADQERTPD